MVSSLKIFHAGPAPLISALFDTLGIGKILDSVLPWDETQCKLPPSIRIKALVINILAGRTPLYNVERFFKFQDTENLLRKGVTHEDTKRRVCHGRAVHSSISKKLSDHEVEVSFLRQMAWESLNPVALPLPWVNLSRKPITSRSLPSIRFTTTGRPYSFRPVWNS
ncbi:MAG TPA: DUF4277 domain-containing protein [Firmicutes bacterium]|nr:DUF4277 domain-containing protein [Bacillota bacterium]